MKKTTLIRVSVDAKQRLEKLMMPGDSFDSVVIKTLESYESIKDVEIPNPHQNPNKKPFWD